MNVTPPPPPPSLHSPPPTPQELEADLADARTDAALAAARAAAAEGEAAALAGEVRARTPRPRRGLGALGELLTEPSQQVGGRGGGGVADTSPSSTEPNAKDGEGGVKERVGLWVGWGGVGGGDAASRPCGERSDQITTGGRG